jgi:hypothetical protein
MRPLGETFWRLGVAIGGLAMLAGGAACGGRLGQNDSPTQGTGPAPLDAGSPLLDAVGPPPTPQPSPVDASATPAASTCGPAATACFACTPGTACDLNAAGAECGGLYFYRLEDFLAYFGDLAQMSMVVVPAHRLDCLAQDLDAGECVYDPRMRQLSPSDIYYSNGQNEFVAPNGLHSIWMYKQDMNAWVVADLEHQPVLYDMVLGWVTCRFPDGGP